MKTNSTCYMITCRHEEIVSEITNVSEFIRYILIVDDKGKKRSHKIISKSIPSDDRSRLLTVDMVVLKRLLSLYDEIAGKNTCIHLIREKVHVLIFYFKDWIFLVSCERRASRYEISNIAEEIESILKRYCTQ